MNLNLITPQWADLVLSRKEALELWNTVTNKLAAEGNALSNSTCAELLLMSMRGRLLAARGYEWEKRGGAGTIQPFSKVNDALPSCLLLEMQFTEVIETLRRNLVSMGSSTLVEQVESTHKVEAKKLEEAQRVAQNESIRKQNEDREKLLEAKRKDKISRDERAKMNPEVSAKKEEEEIKALLQVNNEFRNGMLSLLEEVGKSNKMLDEAANVAESNLQKSERLNNELGKELSEPFCGFIVKLIFFAAMTFASCYMVIKVFPKPPPSNSNVNRHVWSLSSTIQSVFNLGIKSGEAGKESSLNSNESSLNTSESLLNTSESLLNTIIGTEPVEETLAEINVHVTTSMDRVSTKDIDGPHDISQIAVDPYSETRSLTDNDNQSEAQITNIHFESEVYTGDAPSTNEAKEDLDSSFYERTPSESDAVEDMSPESDVNEEESPTLNDETRSESEEHEGATQSFTDESSSANVAHDDVAQSSNDETQPESDIQDDVAPTFNDETSSVNEVQDDIAQSFTEETRPESDVQEDAAPTFTDVTSSTNEVQDDVAQSFTDETRPESDAHEEAEQSFNDETRPESDVHEEAAQ
jgi:hypothetical protein